MSEPPFQLGAFAARQQPHALPGSLAPPVRYAPKPMHPNTHAHSHSPGLDGSVDEEDDGEITCICAYNWDDGYTIQCEMCNKWNHMDCYYPREADRPGPDQTHHCVDCEPREIDARRASAVQRNKRNEVHMEKALRRPMSKAGRKKTKESPQVGLVANGLTTTDKNNTHLNVQSHGQGQGQGQGQAYGHGSGRERKSASPRDQPPPAKRPKTTHRSSNALTNGGPGRKRNGSTLSNAAQSPSKSPGPEVVYGPVIPRCSDQFLHITDSMRNHVDTNTNVWTSIKVTNSLSDWLQDPESVERDCQQKQIDVFKRWDGPFENMPGKPEVSLQNKLDSKFLGTGETIIYPCLNGEQDITANTFIGEILGHVGFKEEYTQEGRWESLRHCEPFVFFHPKLPIYIDARQEGSVYRYVRRSCRPNAEMQTIITEGTTYHFCFMATKDIMAGEEITVGWEFDHRIRAMYAQRSHMTDSAWAPDVRDQIAMWVSNVLANCGPCACSGQGCPMAFFDRRGQAIPLEVEPAPIKPPKRKKKSAGSANNNNVADLDGGRASNSNQASRSGSETRKVEQQDEDMTDSRSASASYQGSASRDITPNTHYSAAAMPELSEREKKKLMREEEMFKKQEEDRGKQRKKRSNAMPNINAANVNASKQSAQSSTSANSKYSDASTSSRTISARTTTGRRVGRPPQSSSRDTPKPSSKSTPKPAYVDSAIQCDMDNDDAIIRPLVTPPKQKRYISVAQRLLRRCASNNLKRSADTLGQDAPPSKQSRSSPMPQGDVMDIDKDETPNPDADTADVLPLSPVSDKVKHADTVGAPRRLKNPPVSPAFDHTDSEMKDVDEEESIRPSSPPHDNAKVIKRNDSIPEEESADSTSNPPMDPPPPPWPARSSQDSPNTSRSQDSPRTTRPNLHLPIPEPPALATESSIGEVSQIGGSVVDSPPTSMPGLTPNAIFPPSVSANLNPSPITRKKMSLSDYTKRSKAQRPESSAGLSHRESSPTASIVSVDLHPGLLQGSAISESPAPESLPASAEGRKLDLASEQDMLEEGEMPPVTTFGDGGLPTVTML